MRSFARQGQLQPVEWFNQVDATYRADLRELNKLNFARFEASMKQQMAELGTRLERRITHVATEFGKRVSAIDSKQSSTGASPAYAPT